MYFAVFVVFLFSLPLSLSLSLQVWKELLLRNTKAVNLEPNRHTVAAGCCCGLHDLYDYELLIEPEGLRGCSEACALCD